MVKILKKGRKISPRKMADEFFRDFRQEKPPFPKNWRGPHRCPSCACEFKLEKGDKNKVNIPEIAMGLDADYYVVTCPNKGCFTSIRVS